MGIQSDQTKILLVDDDKLILKMAQTIFQQMGYNVQATNNTAQALQLINRQSFSALITDLAMPEMDGFELIQSVRKDFPVMPIMVVTKFSDRHSIKKAWSLGANHFVYKPFSANDLAFGIERILEHTKDLKVFNQPDRRTELPPEMDDRNLISIESLVEEYGDEKLVCGFMESFLETLADIRSQLNAQLRSLDEVAIGMILHRLQGSAEQMGFLDLSTLAQKLEAYCGQGYGLKKADLNHLMAIIIRYELEIRQELQNLTAA